MSEKPMAIYSRKSKYTGKGESVENQIVLCRQYIGTQYGAEAAARVLVYEDEGFSGGNLDRPRFRAMMQDAETGKLGTIVVYRLDRISRNIADFAGLIEQLERLGVGFISIREQFDTGSPMGRAMMYMSSVFSQLERETIAERIRDNLHELSKTGRWLGGTTPTGYESEQVVMVSENGKQKQFCRLKLLPDEIGLVLTIYDKYLELGSLTGVDAYLLEHRIFTKRGNRFSRYAIRNILTNPVYLMADGDAWSYLERKQVSVYASRTDFDGTCGMMVYNRTRQHPGKAHTINPMNQWIAAVGEHPGVIPGSVWVQVQNRLEGNRIDCSHRRRNSDALLSGVLRCGFCGDYMRPKKTGRTGADGGAGFVYLCSTRERSKGACCKMKSPDGRILDRMIMNRLSQISFCRRTLVQRLEQGRRTMLRESDRTAEQTEAWCRDRAKALADLSDLTDRMPPEQRRTLINTLILSVIWDAGSLRVVFQDGKEECVGN